MGAALHLARIVEGQRAHLPLWAPVCFGVGIAVYFAAPAEPDALPSRLEKVQVA